MNNLSLVIPYYNSSNIIPKKFEEWQAYDEDIKKCLEIVIVDDGSPEKTAFLSHWVDTKLDIKLYKIDIDIPWNECGANNLGFKVATNQWILRSDVDWYIPNDVLRHIMTMQLSEDSYYIFPGKVFDTKEEISSPYNIYVMHRDIFWKIGGYDEDCRGYYGSDLTFRHRVDKIFRLKQVVLSGKHVEGYYGVSNQHGLQRDATFCRSMLQERIEKNDLMPKGDCLRFTWSRIK